PGRGRRHAGRRRAAALAATGPHLAAGRPCGAGQAAEEWVPWRGRPRAPGPRPLEGRPRPVRRAREGGTGQTARGGAGSLAEALVRGRCPAGRQGRPEVAPGQGRGACAAWVLRVGKRSGAGVNGFSLRRYNISGGGDGGARAGGAGEGVGGAEGVATHVWPDSRTTRSRT